jgi:hypothetical protein
LEEDADQQANAHEVALENAAERETALNARIFTLETVALVRTTNSQRSQEDFTEREAELETLSQKGKKLGEENPPATAVGHRHRREGAAECCQEN